MKINFTTIRQSVCILAIAAFALMSNVAKAQLSGTYTIGGAAPNYVTFNDAVTALSSALGVSGPVTFNVRNGTYTERVVIPEIVGSSTSNTITFQAESGDSSMVTLTQPSSAAAATNYTLQLNGADNIIFNKMTISRTGINTYGRVVDFENMATSDSITHCRIIGVINSGTNSFTSLVYSNDVTPVNDSLNVFTNSLFQNGSHGILMYGQGGGLLEMGTVITNNQFVNQAAIGIYLTLQLGAIVTGNTVTTSTTSTTYRGMLFDACQGALLVSKNKVTGVPGTGIYIGECNGYGAPGVIENNFVQSKDSAGIYLDAGATDETVVANSINCTGANSTALILNGAMVRVNVIDNALVNSAGGLCYLVRSVGGSITSNYNDLYTTGTNVGNYLGTATPALVNWQTASTTDLNSVSIDPVYVSATNLHATSGAFDNLGNLSGTTTSDDIDGQVRCPGGGCPGASSTPDIGADEYVGARHDVSITQLITPLDGTCEDTAAVVSVTLFNGGDFIESNINITCEVTGAGTATLNALDASTLAIGASHTITFATHLNTSGGGTFNFKIYSQLATDAVHANDTLLVSRLITSNPSAPTAVTAAPICGPGTSVLSGTTSSSSDSIAWYTTSTGGTPIGYGSPFTSPFVSDTTTFYAEATGTCVSSTRTAVDLIVYNVPVVNLGNDTSFLQGGNITLDAGAGFLGYAWSTGEGTQTINLTPTGDTCVWARISDMHGCNDTDTICITIIFPTDVGVSNLISPTNGQCNDSLTSVQVEISNFGTASASGIDVTCIISGCITDTLYGNYAGTIPVGGTVVFTFDSTINTTACTNYTFQIYTGLSSDQSHNNDTLTSTLTINPMPDAPIGTSSERCAAGPITVLASSADTIYWYDSSTGGILLNIGTSYTDVNATATYSVWAQAGSTCPSATRSEVILTVHDLPVVNLGADSLVECGSTITLDAGAGFVSYLWSNSDITQTTTVTVGDTSDYSVTVTDTNTCTNSDTIHVDCYVGFASLNSSDDINIFPNPSSGKVELNISSKSSSAIIIRWMNTSGQIIKSDKISNATSVVHRNYDLSSAAKGMYFVQIISSDGVVTKKVSIE